MFQLRKPEMGRKCGRCSARISISCRETLSILLKTCRHGMYTRFPSITSIN